MPRHTFDTSRSLLPSFTRGIIDSDLAYHMKHTTRYETSKYFMMLILNYENYESNVLLLSKKNPKSEMTDVFTSEVLFFFVKKTTI